MTLDEYQEQSITTGKADYGITKLAYYALGLGGETGECRLPQVAVYETFDKLLGEF